MRKRTALLASAAVGVIAVALVAVLALGDPAVNTLSDSPLLGRAAPEIAGTDLAGEPVRLSALRGRFVVVNFFATWCIPCVSEHPELLKFSQRHREAGDAQVLAVIWDDNADEVKKFFDRRGGDWPVIDDRGGEVALAFGVRGPPESFVVDPRGVVVSRIVGEVDAEGLERIVQQASRSAR